MLLTNTVSKAYQLQENLDEIHAGMMLLEYEEFDFTIPNEDPRTSTIVAYKNDTRVITFYVRPEATIGLKIFDLSKGFTKATTNFESIGLNDARTIITKLL